MSKYYPPADGKGQFHCPHCSVFAKQDWFGMFIQSKGASPFSASLCNHCWEYCYWYDGRMLVPSDAPVPPHHEDLPANCTEDYNEARDIVGRSPRAAAALLRLCLQKLMVELDEKGNNINEDIGALVKKGLPVEVQQALDYCRVIGNNAVHPGEIEITGSPEISHSLFEMLNFIVEDRISRPKRISSLYKILPEGALKAVQKRDGENV